MRGGPRLVARAPAQLLFHLCSTLPAVRSESRVAAQAAADADFCRRVVDERLVSMVHHARANVPFYRRSYDRERVAAIRGVKELPLLPMVDRRALQDKFRFVAADTVPERCSAFRTSGSTGEPVTVLRDLEVVYHDQAILRRLYQRFGVRRRWSPFDTSFICLVDTATPRSQRQPTMAFSKAYRFGLREPAWDDPLDALRFLASRPGHILSATPTMLLELHRQSSELDPSRRYEIRPGLVMSSGGPLNEATRRTVGNFLSCPVIDSYAVEEIGVVAVECPLHEGFHVEAPACVVECVRADGSPSAPGEEGELVLTGLRSKSFPLIRYRIGDTGTLLGGQCGCGSTLPRIGRLLGRGGTVFLHRSGARVSPAGLGHGLVGLPLTQHQIEQVEIDRFIFRYRRADGANDSEFRERVHAIFEVAFGPQVDVTLVESAQLGAGGSKVLPYVSHLESRDRLTAVSAEP
jgi:phenylacetate-CoA ligase